MVIEIFILISLLFWFIKIFRDTLSWVYFWQLKEYRLDRFLVHLKSKERKQVFYNKFNLLKIFLFLTIPLLFSYQYYWIILGGLLGIIYLIEGTLFIRNIIKRQFKRPIFTQKAILLTFGTLILAVGLVKLILSGGILRLLFILLAIDIFLLVLISFLVFLLWPFTFIIKKIIIKKAREKIKRFKNLKIIGITGSYGKTSTKEFLATILSSKFRVCKTLGNNNTGIGIAKTILKNLKPDDQIFIVEMAAYTRGEIKAICEIARPEIGVLTSINQQHLALFGSQENIIRAKFELIEALPGNGLAVFNGDDGEIKNFTRPNFQRKLRRARIFYSMKDKLDIWAENINVEKECLSFRVLTKKDSADFKVNLLGVHNISNILGAVAVAKYLGMSLQEIAEAAKKLESPPKTMKLLKGISGLTIIDDTYSANPKGVESALDYLKIYSGKKIIVLRPLIELGRESQSIHRNLGKKIGKICDFCIVTTKDYFQEIKEGAKESGLKQENILYSKNPQEILEKIKTISNPGDMILLENRVGDELIKRLSKLRD